MERDIIVGILLDFYGPLLTDRQAAALDMYYNLDFSLAEIAENIGVTRQCARDFIKKGEAHLALYEEKLGLCRLFNIINDAAEGIDAQTDILEGGRPEVKQKIRELVKVITNVMEL